MSNQQANQQAGERAFDHVLVIMFEHQLRASVLKNQFMRNLARQGIDLRASFGIMHPSQPNYIATIAGELCNVTSEGANTPPLSQPTIVDLIEEAPGRLRWKAYMQSYSPQAQPWTPELVPDDQPLYVVRHNPFASFAAIVRDEDRWQRIVDEAELFSDLLAGELAEFAWFTPNLWNQGQVDPLARWLESFFDRLRFPGPDSHLPARTLVVVTFDESDVEGPNQIYTVLLGDMIQPGMIRPGTEDEGYNHYSLLKTLEVNFGLGSLGKNDAEANWYQFLWNRRFCWGGVEDTPIRAAQAIAAEHFAESLHVVAADQTGALREWTFAEGRWSVARALEGSAVQLGLAATARELVMVALDDAGQLHASRYDMQAGWTAIAGPLNAAPARTLALHGMGDGKRIMLVWQAIDGSLHSRIGSEGEFAAETMLPNYLSHGSIALGRLGCSLYLFARLDSSSDVVSLISYNTAFFNVVNVPTNQYGGAQDDTSVEEWSPSAIAVAHYSGTGLDARTPDELEPAKRPYAARGPITCATLDGVLHVIHRGLDDDALRSETLSLSGLMTPARPISYKSTDWANFSNGYGTAIEAGFSRQRPILSATCAATGVLASARSYERLVTLFQPRAGGPVFACSGRYRRVE